MYKNKYQKKCIRMPRAAGFVQGFGKNSIAGLRGITRAIKFMKSIMEDSPEDIFCEGTTRDTIKKLRFIILSEYYPMEERKRDQATLKSLLKQIVPPILHRKDGIAEPHFLYYDYCMIRKKLSHRIKGRDVYLDDLKKQLRRMFGRSVDEIDLLLCVSDRVPGQSTTHVFIDRLTAEITAAKNGLRSAKYVRNMISKLDPEMRKLIESRVA